MLLFDKHCLSHRALQRRKLCLPKSLKDCYQIQHFRSHIFLALLGHAFSSSSLSLAVLQFVLTPSEFSDGELTLCKRTEEAQLVSTSKMASSKDVILPEYSRVKTGEG